jgi:hypothetical protein
MSEAMVFKRSEVKFELAMCLFAEQTNGTAHNSFNFADQREIEPPLITIILNPIPIEMGDF